MEPYLELMAAVCAHLMDPERELFNYIIDEVNGTGLIVSFIHFQSPDPDFHKSSLLDDVVTQIWIWKNLDISTKKDERSLKKEKN